MTKALLIAALRCCWLFRPIRKPERDSWFVQTSDQNYQFHADDDNAPGTAMPERTEVPECNHSRRQTDAGRNLMANSAACKNVGRRHFNLHRARAAAASLCISIQPPMPEQCRKRARADFSTTVMRRMRCNYIVYQPPRPWTDDVTSASAGRTTW